MTYSIRFILVILSLSVMVICACGGRSQPSQPEPLVSPLNDTGANYCVGLDMTSIDCSAAPEQDGNRGRDALAVEGKLKKIGRGAGGQDLTKLDASGQPIKDQSLIWSDVGSENLSTQWSCVRDNHTGLVWEVKSSSPQSPRYYQSLYQWHLPDMTVNGGEAGDAGSESCGGVLCNTYAYTNWVNQKGLCGFTDWQLPTVNQLLSLVVTDNLNLAVDTHFFPYAQPSHYWTRQSYAPQNTRAWYLYFSDGSPSSTLKSKPMFVRLVRESKGVSE